MAWRLFSRRSYSEKFAVAKQVFQEGHTSLSTKFDDIVVISTLLNF